ncbi:diguanylate cyclase domain-containing protein [Qipengyuania sp. MTN3-11]|uniref:GGDEF domain-containing protein n=1 Tax=Qipengyuania sp. MTN3-11 TaxID=3056557 RepID=UPI0036F3E3E2
MKRLLNLVGSRNVRDEGTEQGDLLDRIAGFLRFHELETTRANLVRAHAALSGEDLHLARKIDEREREGLGITQLWLDSLVGRDEEAPADTSEFDLLRSNLDHSIESFSRTARTARSAATDYKIALSEHARTIDSTDTTGQLLASLADLTKALLERTRQAESEMKRSEREAATLRANLEKAQRAADLDHLTGLPNRRAFEGLLEHHYREARSQVEPLCVAFCDIDHFKPVNDTHGHETGDRVIQMIAQTLAQASNDNCHVARQGGDEFVLLFRGLTLAEAHAKLERVRERLADRSFVNRATDKPIGAITFSGGLADVFAYPDQRAALRAADEALYRAKGEGRNRVELAGPTA